MHVLKKDPLEVAAQSHLIVRVTTETGRIIDIVEMAGSEQAVQGHAGGKASEQVKRFVTNTFNAVSVALTRKGTTLKEQEQNSLT